MHYLNKLLNINAITFYIGFTKDVVPLFTKKKQAQFREQTKALKFNDMLVHINQEAIALSRAAWGKKFEFFIVFIYICYKLFFK